MPTSFSGTYTVPSCAPTDTGAAIVQADKLYYFYRERRSNDDATIVVKRTYFKQSFVDAQAFGNPDGWGAPIEVQTPPLSTYESGEPAEEGEAIEAPTGLFTLLDSAGAILLLWMDSQGNMWGTRSSKQDAWEPRFQLEGIANGRTTAAHSFSAYWYSEKLVVLWSATDSNVRAVAFSAGEIQPATNGEEGRIWPADAEPMIVFGVNPGSNIVSLASALTVLPTVSSGAFASPGQTATGSTPALIVGQFLQSYDATHIWMKYTMPVDKSTGLPNTARATSQYGTGNPTLCNINRDVSNTVYLYGTGIGQSSASSVLSMAPLMDAQTGALNASGEIGPPTTLKNQGMNAQTQAVPQIAYLGGSVTAGQLTASNGAVLQTEATPMYRFVFFMDPSSSSAGRVIVDFYGTLHLVESTTDLYVSSTGALADKIPNGNLQQDALVAKGIIDGPLPIPQSNMRMLNDQGTITEWGFYKPIGKVVYGTNQSEGTTHKVTYEGAVGAQMSFEAAAGWEQTNSVLFEVGIGVYAGDIETVESSSFYVGAKVDAEVSVAYDNTHEWGMDVANEANIVALTRVLPQDSDGGHDEPGASAVPVLSTQGFISGSAMSVVCEAVVFQSPTNPGTLPGRAVTVSLLPQSRVQLSGHYSATYAFTPGDLSSYSIDNITANMRTTYQNWLNTKKAPSDPDPFGPDYNDYFNSVIDKCALRIGPTGKNYLEFSVSNEGFSEAMFELSKHDFKEWGVTLDSSIYAAFTQEASGDIAGAAVKEYFELGGSIEFSAGYSSGSERSSSWGISASIDDFPQGVRSGDVCAYSFRLYLLPSDNRWIQEVICFSDYYDTPANGKKPLDPNAKPFKILFVVDPSSIQYMP